MLYNFLYAILNRTLFTSGVCFQIQAWDMLCMNVRGRVAVFIFSLLKIVHFESKSIRKLFIPQGRFSWEFFQWNMSSEWGQLLCYYISGTVICRCCQRNARIMSDRSNRIFTIVFLRTPEWPEVLLKIYLGFYLRKM